MNSLTRFVSIDIETTGLNPETCSIIEIGAVIDDWLDPIDEPPTFHCYIKRHEYSGEPYALSMHPTIFRRIAIEERGFNYFYPSEAVVYFGAWLKEFDAYQIDPNNPDHEPRAVVAGKNFAMFDDKFLRKLPHFDQHIKYHHRIIDPAMLFWNPLTDIKPPGTETCMQRAGLQGTVAHNALDDAIVVSKMIHVAVGRRVQPKQLLDVILERRQLLDAKSPGAQPLIQ